MPQAGVGQGRRQLEFVGEQGAGNGEEQVPLGGHDGYDMGKMAAHLTSVAGHCSKKPGPEGQPGH
ncbi:hypothetical protein KAM338_21920 [Aeromonas caviae]|nr:hypothetical protein KAM330_04870 [Aeromonas hydrophila]GKQ62015.1 hypothetical protein KAM338_21920 [Aeromonas caviae]